MRTTCRTGWFLAACVAALAVTATATAGPVPVRACGSLTFQRQSGQGAFNIKARGTDCSTARAVARRSAPTRFSSGNPHYHALGFYCAGHEAPLDPANPALYVVRFRCSRGHSAVSFLR